MTMGNGLRIIVTGLIAHHPLGGVCWDYVQYPLALARLGHDVYYFEDTGEWPYRLRGSSDADWFVNDSGDSIRYLSNVMTAFGLGDRWAYHSVIDDGWAGLSDGKRAEVLASADLLLNISGTIAQPDIYAAIPTRAYLDSDPVFTQIKLADPTSAFRALVDAHNVHFTFGETLPASLPDGGHRWHPTRQPVLLDEWETVDAPGRSFTTVMNWSSYPPEVHNGTAYAQKDVEFVKYLDLPARVAPVTIEVAGRGLAVDAPKGFDDDADTCHELLVKKGFHVVDSLDVCGDFERYRRYVQSSRAEWSVAKNGYVDGRSGWFSCRSACYLAAGRPVVVQDTGFGGVIPVDEGVVAFSTPDEAVSAIRHVEQNYARHARAAREIAREYFGSDKVLNRLLETALNGARESVRA